MYCRFCGGPQNGQRWKNTVTSHTINAIHLQLDINNSRVIHKSTMFCKAVGTVPKTDWRVTTAFGASALRPWTLPKIASCTGSSNICRCCSRICRSLGWRLESIDRWTQQRLRRSEDCSGELCTASRRWSSNNRRAENIDPTTNAPSSWQLERNVR